MEDDLPPDEDESTLIPALALAVVASKLKDFTTNAGIQNLLSPVRISGMTIREHLAKNKQNTMNAFIGLFERAVRGATPLDQALDQVDAMTGRKKRDTLYTLKNIMGAVRGQARAVVVGGRAGTWYNIGTLDGGTTEVCAGYMGASWDIPYSQIPNKPPRVSITPHPCRSFLTFRKRGDNNPPPEAPFMEQFNASEDLQRDLLKPARYAAFKSGDLKIKSFNDYEKATLNTLEDLGID